MPNSKKALKWKKICRIIVIRKGINIVIKIQDAKGKELYTVTGKPPFGFDISEAAD